MSPAEPGRRRAARVAAVTVAALGLAAGAAGAALDAYLDDGVISACRTTSTGALRVPSAGVSCRSDEQPLQWSVRGPTGPQGPPGPVSVATLEGTGCTTAAGMWGKLRVRTDVDGNVTFVCRAAEDPYAAPKLVLNEIDYDQVGADSGGFVELYNDGLGTADLGGLALVFVNGGDGQEYLRVPLSGSILAGDFRVVSVDAQNGFPDGVALYDAVDQRLIDALSYEGPIRRAFIGSFAYDLVEGTVLPTSVADSDTLTGSLARLPNGSDTNDAATDWAFTRTVTPGNPNFAG